MTTSATTVVSKMPTQKPHLGEIFRFALLEIIVVALGLLFVKRELYLGGHWGEMAWTWQEYSLMALVFIDGVIRGRARSLYSSPFRKKYLRFLLPIGLFLFVACATLCAKLNITAVRAEWFRDLGLFILASGVAFLAWTQQTRPRDLSQFHGSVEATTVISNDEIAEEKRSDSVSEKDSLLVEEKDADAKKKNNDDPDDIQQTEDLPLGQNAVPQAEDLPVGQDNVPQAEELNANRVAESKMTELDSVSVPSLWMSPGNIESFQPTGLRGPWKFVRYPGRTAIFLELIGISITLCSWMPLLTLPGLLILFKWELADVEAFRLSQFGDAYIQYKKRSWFLLPFLY